MIDEEAIDIYLEELRDSGETNMFGARPYLMEEFGLSKAEAASQLTRWMKNYGKKEAGQ